MLQIFSEVGGGWLKGVGEAVSAFVKTWMTTALIALWLQLLCASLGGSAPGQPSPLHSLLISRQK